VGEITDDDMTRAQVEAAQGLYDLKNQFKLLSFTQDDPDAVTPGEYGRGYVRSRLWELYADVGRGVCLVLHKERAITEIVSQLERHGPEHHGSVCYENHRLSSEIFFDLEPLLAGRYAEAEEEKLGQYMEELFFTKNTEWTSESEYRFVVRTPDAEPVYVDVSQSLQGLCLGRRHQSSTSQRSATCVKPPGLPPRSSSGGTTTRFSSIRHSTGLRQVLPVRRHPIARQ